MGKIIQKNEYMRMEKTEKGSRTYGKRILNEKPILKLMKEEMRAGDIINKIRIPGEFFPLGVMWNWLTEREKEGKVTRRIEPEKTVTLWRAV